MGSKGSSEYRARQRERERRRRRQPRRAASELEQQASDARVPAASARQARRAAATACGWCAGPIALRPRGPIPKWCSATCRHRAWEQARAAASGRAAVQVVERIVVTAVEKPVVATPRHNDWIELLGELSRQLDRGVVYDPDLRGLVSLSTPPSTPLTLPDRRLAGVTDWGDIPSPTGQPSAIQGFSVAPDSNRRRLAPSPSGRVACMTAWPIVEEEP